MFFDRFRPGEGKNPMVKRLVSEWLVPFGQPRFRKPNQWADNLRPNEGSPVAPGLPQALTDGIKKAQTALLRKQNFEDGYWCAEIFGGDRTIDCDTIMLLNFLGKGDSPKIPRLAHTILGSQLEDGGWSIYLNGPADVSATTKAYWALKFAGYSSDHPALERARKRIEALGGIHKVDTYSKFYMALFGLYDWEGVPSIPPELMLFPTWFYFNIYEMSSWTRAIVMPLSIIWATQPEVDCPDHARLDELFPDERRFVPIKQTLPPHRFFSWTNFFLWWDKGLKKMEGNGPHWVREWALQLAEDWILERLDDSDGLGAIFPGILNCIMAMRCLGYPDTDPRFREQLAEFEKLEDDVEDALAMEPCKSPVWDTAIAMIMARVRPTRMRPA